MRGRRTGDQGFSPLQWSEFDNQAGVDRSDFDGSLDSDLLEPRKLRSDYYDDLAAAVRQREQLGALGQHMLKRFGADNDYASLNYPIGKSVIYLCNLKCL